MIKKNRKKDKSKFDFMQKSQWRFSRFCFFFYVLEFEIYFILMRKYLFQVNIFVRLFYLNTQTKKKTCIDSLHKFDTINKSKKFCNSYPKMMVERVMWKKYYDCSHIVSLIWLKNEKKSALVVFCCCCCSSSFFRSFFFLCNNKCECVCVCIFCSDSPLCLYFVCVSFTQVKKVVQFVNLIKKWK